MPVRQHCVRLSAEERATLHQVLRRTGATALAHRRARMLLQVDAGVHGRQVTDRAVALAVGVDPRTVARVRALYARTGLAATLRPHPRRQVTRRKLDCAAESRLVAIACAAPPPGQARWSLRLLARELVVLEVVEGISPETVRTTLKKTGSNRG